MKVIAKIPDASTKEELRNNVRGDFERYRHIEDTNKI
jgi:hypothetical protein